MRRLDGAVATTEGDEAAGDWSVLDGLDLLEHAQQQNP
jgi:hypothetical protein